MDRTDQVQTTRTRPDLAQLRDRGSPARLKSVKSIMLFRLNNVIADT